MDGPDAAAPAAAAETLPGEEPSETTEDATVYEDGVELERTIGLRGALAIGVGTMIGAGIFVFPGLAAGDAGPAAALSFAIGAVIALLVALPTAELATAMPRSGGGYFFISRGLGTALGTVVGVSLWLGLTFASAFYLVGFGNYAAAVLAEVGLAPPVDPVVLLALVFAVGLTALSVTGTENTAALQNYVVATLLAILTVFLVYGGLQITGVLGEPNPPETFFRFGYAPVLSTAALTFTSYLGFAQVATVAGEVREPARTLPLSMVGSVVVVGVFYVAAILVATGAFGSLRLATFGETAMVEVARHFAGLLGAVAILVAGLLATLSSANASILSSSRAAFALSRDGLIPRRIGTVNLRYGTPHVALGLTGGTVLALVAVGEVAVLAEVASFLHLVMYGLMCATLLVLRRRDPPWYDPDFTVPGYPAVPAVGMVASFALLAFMQRTSQLIGLVVMVGAVGWYAVAARDVRLRGVFE